MNITIASIGKFRNSPYQAIFDLYLKRLPWKVELKELEIKSKLNVEIQKQKEGLLLLDAVKSCHFIIVLDEKGHELNSRELAKFISDLRSHGNSHLGFIIGGSDGVCESVKAKAHKIISLGKVTFPHLMVRSILAEQLYRSYSIISNHPYHRD